jgi:chitodextrinase
MVWIGTTRTSMTLDLAANHTYEFRVAARDKAGNWGAWSLAKAFVKAPTGSVVVGR